MPAENSLTDISATWKLLNIIQSGTTTKVKISTALMPQQSGDKYSPLSLIQHRHRYPLSLSS